MTLEQKEIDKTRRTLAGYKKQLMLGNMTAASNIKNNSTLPISLFEAIDKELAK